MRFSRILGIKKQTKTEKESDRGRDRDRGNRDRERETHRDAERASTTSPSLRELALGPGPPAAVSPAGAPAKVPGLLRFFSEHALCPGICVTF